MQNYASVIFYIREVLYDAKKFPDKEILFGIVLLALVADYFCRHILVRAGFFGIVRFRFGDSFRSFVYIGNILGMDDISRSCHCAHICFNMQ